MVSRLLTPFALLQAAWLAARTPRLPAARGRRGRCGDETGALLRVVGVGDSIIAGTGVAEQRHALTGQFAEQLHGHTGRAVEWQVYGVNGATSSTVLRKVAPRVPVADVYVLSMGVNDAVRGVDRANFRSNLLGLLDELRGRAPRATVIFAGLPPLQHFPALPWPLGALLSERARALQAEARALAGEQPRWLCYDFVDRPSTEAFARDGFHPAETGCADWARGLVELWRCSQEGAR